MLKRSEQPKKRYRLRITPRVEELKRQWSSLSEWQPSAGPGRAVFCLLGSLSRIQEADEAEASRLAGGQQGCQAAASGPFSEEGEEGKEERDEGEG